MGLARNLQDFAVKSGGNVKSKSFAKSGMFLDLGV